jgi:predicted NUDIX family NTP pyrophosphohydrolase
MDELLSIVKNNKTCGVFVFNPDGRMLICHVTNADKFTWSIPKGRIDGNERPVESAIRELREETGIIAEEADLKEIGRSSYKSGRELIAFSYYPKYPIDPATLKCESMVEKENVEAFPEIDGYAFINVDLAHTYVHGTQQKVLTAYLEKTAI